MKMNRREFSAAYVAALAGSKLAAGEMARADTPGRFHFDEKTRRYSLEGPVGIQNARLGVEIDGISHGVDKSAHVTWKESITEDS
jgi:hypothetical protein